MASPSGCGSSAFFLLGYNLVRYMLRIYELAHEERAVQLGRLRIRTGFPGATGQLVSATTVSLCLDLT